MTKQAHTFLRRIKRPKFGELLLSQGTVTPEQLNEALELQRRDGGLLGEIMVAKGFITENEVVRSLSTQYGLPVLRTNDYEVDKDLVSQFPARLLYVNYMLPLSRLADLLLVAVADLPDEETIAVLEEQSQCEVVFYISATTDISDALVRYVPVSERDLEEFISCRRRKPSPGGQVAKAVAPKTAPTAARPAAPEPPRTAQQKRTPTDMDNAWESIFDEAEQNLKTEGL